MTYPSNFDLGSNWDEAITDPPAPANQNDPQFIVAVKKGIIQALRNTFNQTDYPDKILQNMNINMEYPSEEEEYPGIWVQFNFRDLQASGINNKIFTQQTSDPLKPRRYQLWMFGGTVTLTIVALTSKERDTIADKVIQMYAFHRLNSKADKFRRFLAEWPYIFMNTNGDMVRPGGQSTTVGAPWQPDVLVYEDSYSFDLLGQFASDFPTGDLVRLREIVSLPYAPLLGQPRTDVDDGNGEWEYG